MAEPPIVDFAAHFYSPMPAAQADSMARIEGHDGEPICTDIEVLRDRFAAAGVDAIVLSQPFHMGSDDVEATAESNDHLVELTGTYPELFGLAAIPTAAGGEAAAAEFERALDAGLHGGGLETNSAGIELVDDALEPVFAVADDRGAPVLVHPKLRASLGPEALAAPGLNSVFGREIALAESVWKVVHAGVYDRFPSLRLVFHHGGGNIAAFFGRIEGDLRRAQRRGTEELEPFGTFRRTFESRVYVDTSGYFGDPHQLQRTAAELPASNVLYGSDFPYETRQPREFGAIADAVASVRGGADRDAILGGNAMDLLVNAD